MQHIPTVLDHGFEYIGGDIAADFVNTTSFRYDPERGHEHIQTYADLVEFARLAGLIKPGVAKKLLTEAERHPDKAAEIYRRTVVLREATWRAFSKLAHGRQPAADDVRVIGAEAADALGHAEVTRAGDGWEWAWSDNDDLARPLWPVARAASELLMNDVEAAQLRECADETCAWLFVDRTKNHSRRWCDMNGCGSRNRVREFRQRQKRTARKAR